jgi:predicted CXXCH cytochrome family protein
MYNRGVKCSSCHDVHGTENNALLLKPAAVMCLECHGPGSPNGPHTSTVQEHTHHKADSTGSECVSCHMPKIEQTIADVNVRSHTFRFITPAMTAELKIPNPCITCHKEKTNEWATQQLRTWSNVSPWRIGR